MDGKSTLGVAWWLTIFPGVFITLTVLAYNLVGERLRDMLEPRLKE
jgi:peptide/nickel transport system permease protein